MKITFNLPIWPEPAFDDFRVHFVSWLSCHMTCNSTHDCPNCTHYQLCTDVIEIGFHMILDPERPLVLDTDDYNQVDLDLLLQGAQQLNRNLSCAPEQNCDSCLNKDACHDVLAALDALKLQLRDMKKSIS